MFWGGGILNKQEPQEQINKNENVELAIYIEEEQTNTIPSKNSGYYLDLEKSSCTNDATITWDSVTWSPVILHVKNYPVRCELYFTTLYTEGILNGTDPVLKDELVPITIDTEGTVRRASLTSKWYSYEEKQWANAVILEDQYDSLNARGKVYGATKNEEYVSFDGEDDYIDLGLENYDFGSEVTLMARVRINEYNAEDSPKIVSNIDNGGTTLEYSQEDIRFAVYIGNEYQIISSKYSEGIWYDLAGTYDGEMIKLYFNGELVSQMEMSGNIVIAPTTFNIGVNPNIDGNLSEYGNMDIEQVAIYNRALSEEEIKEDAKESIKVVDDTGLLRYVDFTNRTYEENEIIPESSIESYFVWIPKYRYQLWDLGLYDSVTSIDTSKVHEIPIIFGDYNTSDSVEGECTTPMTSGETRNCTVGDYMTHPAFLSIPSTGFWVGKFKTGYDGAANVSDAQQNVNDSSKIVVKPNVYSWRSIQVANAFYTSYDYKRNLDSHMMKNTEWGTVAYLQHSVYGSTISVRINNNSDYKTGYAANNEPTCVSTGTNEECNIQCNDNSCNTAYPDSNLSSTTGNISGIFDMSGGAWDYVMGVMLDENGNPVSGTNSSVNSGFNGSLYDGTSLTSGYDFPESKYYDTYVYGTSAFQYQRRILGDATGEMGPYTTVLEQNRVIGSWYSDVSWFVEFGSPWFRRGGNYSNGLDAGIFSYNTYTGYILYNNSFRIVLTP